MPGIRMSNDDVDGDRRHAIEKRLPVGGFEHNLNAKIAEQRLEPFTHQRLIVSERDSHGCGLMRVVGAGAMRTGANRRWSRRRSPARRRAPPDAHACR